MATNSFVLEESDTYETIAKTLIIIIHIDCTGLSVVRH